MNFLLCFISVIFNVYNEFLLSQINLLLKLFLIETFNTKLAKLFQNNAILKLSLNCCHFQFGLRKNNPWLQIFFKNLVGIEISERIIFQSLIETCAAGAHCDFQESKEFYWNSGSSQFPFLRCLYSYSFGTAIVSCECYSQKDWIVVDVPSTIPLKINTSVFLCLFCLVWD